MLTPSGVKNAKPQAKPYKVTDGRGMYLLVKPDGAKWWRFDYRRPGTSKRNTLSLGVYPDVSLKRARERREEARILVADGIDPGTKRQTEQAATANTFEAISREWLEIRRGDWSPTHYEKQRIRLEKHAFPWVGARALAGLGIEDLRPVLERVIRGGKLETAHRLRYIMSNVFKFAIATGRAENDPADALSAALPSRRAKKRHPTITDEKEIAGLLRALDTHSGTFQVSCILKLAPMWFCRPGEIRTAEWSHIDLDSDEPTYMVPPANRKLRRAEKESPDTLPHVIPLSTQAVKILRELQPFSGHRRYVFPGGRDPRHYLSENAVTAALARLGYQGIMSGHGFRHMATTRLREMGWPRDVVEAQMSHKIPGVEGVYNMAQYMPERRRMMQAWSDYLDALKRGTEVVPIRGVG